MNQSKIPTLLALLLLLVGLASAIFIFKQIQVFTIGANPTVAPQNIQVTNIKDTTFTVTWTTDSPTIGFVHYSNTNSAPTDLGIIHSVQISNLKPATTYTFTLNSAGLTFDNSGSPWEVQTKSGVASSNLIASGKILQANAMPAANALVFAKTSDGQVNSSITSLAGNWVIPIPNITDSPIIEISVLSDANQKATAKIASTSANPTPVITLGQTYDFTNTTETVNMDTPKVSIDLP